MTNYKGRFLTGAKLIEGVQAAWVDHVDLDDERVDQVNTHEAGAEGFAMLTQTVDQSDFLLGENCFLRGRTLHQVRSMVVGLGSQVSADQLSIGKQHSFFTVFDLWDIGLEENILIFFDAIDVAENVPVVRGVSVN